MAPRRAGDLVLLAVSRANRCAYCVAAHSTAADHAEVPTEVTDALRAGDPLPDTRLDALATFTTTMVDKRGLPSCADVEAFLAAGFNERDIPQVVLAIAVKLSSDRNHPFHTPVDPGLCSPRLGRLGLPVRGLGRVAGLTVRAGIDAGPIGFPRGANARRDVGAARCSVQRVDDHTRGHPGG